ncbi:GntR family transcriptional regulator [Leucobacter insecticola]|uniref:GntR family transcriptional regulator n=1 Tax=Leucobacter insecticola TaxID=2714934 RepID=A0A6G8FIW0_9MICO|nr:GntR family transcriptional regulator [Leucobacter insecticola]QIM16305.1 GntR family transcriptional regulator [Leucobacter insecticola]
MTQQDAAADALTVFTVDQSAASPPFRQLHDAVVRGISDGRLLPGQRLPTTRALAAHLGLALNTVASAYRALEEAGIVEGRGRAGTFVSLGEDPVTSAARAIALDAAGRIRALGLDAEATRRLLTEAVEAV